MRITIAAVGRARAPNPEQALCDLHWERAVALSGKLGFSKLDFAIVDVSHKPVAQGRMAEEAVRLEKRFPESAHRIALDEAGRQYTSEGFAKQLARLRDSGMRDAVFIIGGPDGLVPALRESAAERMAFGPQTWPHLMVRAMLAEQIYRAFAILSGHPYHRGRV